ncbi:cytochrome D1 domain-containing protein [Novosphingobium sp. ZW T3_23]|uniref:YVTN family beta-propeller repeat protein n=1 Tax=Novosphingobium sp. ZW T3_23 TaxID=3378084 RepID=UPI003854BAD9
MRWSLGVQFAFCMAAFAFSEVCDARSVSVNSQTLIVVNKGENTVSFIDLPSGREKSRVATGPSPHEAALSPDGKSVAVAAYGGSTVDVFDVKSARLTARIDIDPNRALHGIAWIDTRKLVLAAEKSRSLVVVDVPKGTFEAIALGQPGTHMVALSPNRKIAYATNVAAGTISVVDLFRLRKIKDIQVGGKPEGLAVSADGKRLWVGDNSAPKVRIVDIQSGEIVNMLSTDPVPIRVVGSPNGKMIVTSNIGAGTLSVFDARTNVPLRSIVVSGMREAVQVTVAFAPDSSKVYVAETGADRVVEVDLVKGEVLRNIKTGKGGDGIAISSSDTKK